MADVVASLLGIVTFSVQVTKVLYEFGSTAASAKQQSDYVARNISLYGNVLDMLIERLQEEVAADVQIISPKAIQLAEQLHSQSFDLFTQIQGMLPRNAGDRVPLNQRLKWTYKKSKVDMFVREIECLKSTAQLLVSVLFAGRKIHNYYNLTPVQTQPETLAAIRNQCTRAENSLVEYIDASESLQQFVEQEERAAAASGSQAPSIQPADESAAGVHPQQSVEDRRVDLHLTTSVLAAFQQTIHEIPDPLVQRQLVLQSLATWLSELFGEWTVIQLLQKNNSFTADRLLTHFAHSTTDSSDEDFRRQQESLDSQMTLADTILNDEVGREIRLQQLNDDIEKAEARLKDAEEAERKRQAGGRRVAIDREK